ncbi:FCN1 [Branchiostoma lanceolatum]|uniref:FCN1 protein n=1 Tax=Branchiostoma lanceolatum TaxID=7740 RepID=A0A8K0AE29_BRALA|nr:FCN1 [Branchiostoma lanceolatum]
MSKDKLMTGDLTFAESVHADRRSRVRSAAGVQVACAVAVVLSVTALVVVLQQNYHLTGHIVSLETRLQERNNQLLVRMASTEALTMARTLDVNSRMRNVEAMRAVADDSDLTNRPPLPPPDLTNRRRAKRAANSVTLPFGSCTQGPPGRDGQAGRDGMPGRDGREGDDGPAGPPGSPGSRGPRGQPGPPGSSGSKGSDGRNGSDGVPGPPGPAGPPGNCNTINSPRMKDCDDVYKAGQNTDGIYTIQPVRTRDPFRVFCEMAGGVGWTLLQRRLDGSVDFVRDWQTYKHGFGDLNGEFWLGNEKLSQITDAKSYSLKVSLENWSSGTVYADYDSFYVEKEVAKYRMHIGSYTGTAGNSLNHHDGKQFSTYDQDNDDDTAHCALSHGRGGWWYGRCDEANLNAPYKLGGGGNNAVGIEWEAWTGHAYSIKSSVMKIRPNLPL